MPFVSVNGQLIEVTQAQYDAYTAPTIASSQTVAAGGTVTLSDSSTSTILTPNTGSTTPGQLLPTTAVEVAYSAAEVADPNASVTSADVTQLNAIATAAGVDAGDVATDPGTISEASLYQGQNSLTAEQLNAIAASQGVDAGDAGAGDVTDAELFAAENSSDPVAAGVFNAQRQQVRSDRRRVTNNGDWRVRLRLAPLSKYLYNAPSPGILKPLQVTDGIIFPYTPTISTAYRANYSPYDLTHSNYRGYFYTNSFVDAINLTATFTAQDTNDANYLLAVIHFLRSATKMFYGQDAERGSPPPVVFLSGLGEYQFNEHSCLISQFQYNLPADVDYIRAGSPNTAGLNLTSIRDRQSVATNSVFGSLNRLAAAFLNKGAINGPGSPPTLGLNRPTYVPTKMDITLTLMPIQSRNQVSKQFSLKEFANGNLLKGGFW